MCGTPNPSMSAGGTGATAGSDDSTAAYWSCQVCVWNPRLSLCPSSVRCLCDADGLHMIPVGFGMYACPSRQIDRYSITPNDTVCTWNAESFAFIASAGSDCRSIGMCAECCCIMYYYVNLLCIIFRTWYVSTLDFLVRYEESARFFVASCFFFLAARYVLCDSQIIC